jgi:hypothetical protein
MTVIDVQPGFIAQRGNLSGTAIPHASQILLAPLLSRVGVFVRTLFKCMISMVKF